jgi:hypothetical protein
MNDPRFVQTLVFGLLGAVIGGAVGYYAFIWIAHQGFYAIMLPGALVGLGAGLCARRRSFPLAVTCAALSVALGLYSEWRLRPFTADPSFSYFFANLHRVTPINLILIAVGAYFGYRWALGSERR